MPKNVRYSLSQYKRSNFIANTRENIKTDIISILQINWKIYY